VLVTAYSTITLHDQIKGGPPQTGMAGSTGMNFTRALAEKKRQ